MVAVVTGAAILLSTLAGGAPAVGSLAYQNPVEHAVGARAWPLLLGVGGIREQEGSRWWVEAGQRYLFGINGLAVSAARVGVGGRRWRGICSLVALTSSVGGEWAISADVVHLRQGALSASGGVGMYVSHIDGGRASYVLATSLRVSISPSPRLAVGYAAHDVRLAGEDLPGVETSAYVSLLPGAPVGFTALVRIARDGVLSSNVAAQVRVGRRMSVAVGYDEGSAMLKGAVSVRAAAFGVSVGSSFHSVLGVSKSVFLSWHGGR